MAELEPGLIAPDVDPYRYFGTREREAADWSAANGLKGLRSVRERDALEGVRTTDGIFAERPGVLRTIELKALDEPTENAVKQGIRRARRQSRIVIIDGRAAGIGMSEATAGLRRGIRDYGHDVDQVVVVLADSTAMGWKP